MDKAEMSTKREEFQTKKARTEIYVEPKNKDKELFKDWVDVVSYHKPKNRAECQKIKTFCPFVSCKYHLSVDVNPNTKSIRFKIPDTKVEESRTTCTLDAFHKGAVALEEVRAVMNLTRERVHQLEIKALSKFDQGKNNYNIKNFSFLSDK